MPTLSDRVAGARAIVFDFDGVIVESGDIKTAAFVELFAAHPEHREAIRRHHLENLGISRYAKFEWISRELLGRELDGAGSARLDERFSELVFDRVVACPLTPGARPALEELARRMPLFVASGTPQKELDRIVEARDLGRYFAEVWGSPTPKAEILLDLMRRHAIAPAAMLMIGDGVSDFEAAQRSGARFIAREHPAGGQDWTSRDVERIRSLSELLAGPGP